MSKRSYRWDPEAPNSDGTKGALVERGADWVDPGRGSMWGKLTSEGEQFDGLRTTDGVDISSRRKRREYMAATGTTDPSDFRGAAGSVHGATYAERAAEARRKHFAGEVDVSGGRRREQLAQMLSQRGIK